MKSALKPHNLANEVRLKRTQHSGAFLLVEGSDDGRFYRRFIDPEHCHIVIGLNKASVVSAITLLDDTSVVGALGAVDCDFDNLDGKVLPSRNLFWGDCHDIESMLVRSQALESVLHEFSSPLKLDEFEARHGGPFRTWLLETALCLGHLRWHSLSTGLGLRFEGLHFSRFVDPKTLSLNPKVLCNELRKQSQNYSVSETRLMAAGWPQTQPTYPWQVCCGHDLVELLTLGLRRAIGSQQGLTADDVASALRLAFSKQDFADSALFVAIDVWESNSHFRVMLR